MIREKPEAKKKKYTSEEFHDIEDFAKTKYGLTEAEIDAICKWGEGNGLSKEDLLVKITAKAEAKAKAKAKQK